MELSSLSNPYEQPSTSNNTNPNPNNRRMKMKLVKEELELRGRPEKEISPWWKILTVLSYFVIVIGGISTSISIGTLVTAFKNNCILYARITLKGLDEVAAAGNVTLYDDNIVDQHYGSWYDCSFTVYCSASSVIFGGVWGILFLQCGRGGITRKSQSESWKIVPPALVVDVVFFILACVIFGKTAGGLSFFCNHLKAETLTGEPSNISTCSEILRFHFPDDTYNTNLYLNYIIAQIGSFLTFLGWLVALSVLVLRCFTQVDFVVYGRRLYETHDPLKPGSSSSQSKRRIFATTKIPCVGGLASSSSFEVISGVIDDEDGDCGLLIATTSFTTVSTKADVSKKLT